MEDVDQYFSIAHSVSPKTLHDLQASIDTDRKNLHPFIHDSVLSTVSLAFSLPAQPFSGLPFFCGLWQPPLVLWCFDVGSCTRLRARRLAPASSRCCSCPTSVSGTSSLAAPNEADTLKLPCMATHGRLDLLLTPYICLILAQLLIPLCTSSIS